MAATTEQIARLRRMTNEPTSTVYSDTTLAAAIERYPLVDEFGHARTWPDGTLDTAWTATYDLNAAAADIWDEKAAALEAEIDATLDNNVAFKCSQRFEHATRQARHYRARRSFRVALARPEPRSADDRDAVVNAGCY